MEFYVTADRRLRFYARGVKFVRAVIFVDGQPVYVFELEDLGNGFYEVDFPSICYEHVVVFNVDGIAVGTLICDPYEGL